MATGHGRVVLTRQNTPVVQETLGLVAEPFGENGDPLDPRVFVGLTNAHVACGTGLVPQAGVRRDQEEDYNRLRGMLIFDGDVIEVTTLNRVAPVVEAAVLDVLTQAIRRRKPRTVADTETLCGDVLDWFPPAECRNYIRHAGYGPQGSN
jgi:hypothetical protein